MAKYITLGEAMQDEIRDLIREELSNVQFEKAVRQIVKDSLVKEALADMVKSAVRDVLLKAFGVSGVSEYQMPTENAVTKPTEPIQTGFSREVRVFAQPAPQPEPLPEPKPEPKPESKPEPKNPPFKLGEQAGALAQLKQELEKKAEPELEFKCEPIHNCDIVIRRAYNSGKPKYMEIQFRTPQYNSRLVDKIEKLGLKFNRKQYKLEGYYSEDVWKKLKDMIGVDETQQDELARMEAEITAMLEAEEAIKKAAQEAEMKAVLEEQVSKPEIIEREEETVNDVRRLTYVERMQRATEMDAEAELLVTFLRDDKKGGIVSLEQILTGTKCLIQWGVNPTLHLNQLMKRQPGIKRASRGYYHYDIKGAERLEAVLLHQAR